MAREDAGLDERRVVEHGRLLENYHRLIPKFKFKANDKQIDEYDSVECVVCMEPFLNDTLIRKLPHCKHIFHDQCLMKWLDGPTQQESQKCPSCNVPITVELLEKALYDEQNSKRSVG